MKTAANKSPLPAIPSGFSSACSLDSLLPWALPRFDLRKQLLLDESNAIGTTGLRAGLLPQAQRIQARQLLLQYVAARQAYSRASLGQQELTTAIDRTKSTQTSLWQIAQESARQNPTAITGLFVSELNEMIDLSEKRLTALENRIPPHHLAHAVADRISHLLHLWLLAAQKILAGSGGHSTDDRHGYGIDR
jgi:hypothetical protein